MRKTIPTELAEALEEHFKRYPEKGEIKICSSIGSVLMKDIPNEIREGTEIGIDYEKALYKMAFEDLIDGTKKL